MTTLTMYTLCITQRVGVASKACFAYSKQVLCSRAALLTFLLRVVRDVDKAEIGFAVTFIIVQSYSEESGMDIFERS